MIPPLDPRVTRVYIQAKEGVLADDTTFKAWDGFTRRAAAIEFFEPYEVYLGSLDLSPGTIVCGGVPCVQAALRHLGVAAPESNCLPDELSEYRGRQIAASTVGELRKGTPPFPWPVFVKPLWSVKGFPGFVASGPEDLTPTREFSDEMEVLVSECVRFVSEWRCFVCRGEILNLSWYRGEPLAVPDVEMVRRAVASFSNSPAAYGIDFGITDDGRTLLVEVNDAYSLGCYGLPPVAYSEMLEAHWLELIQVQSPQPA